MRGDSSRLAQSALIGLALACHGCWDAEIDAAVPIQAGGGGGGPDTTPSDPDLVGWYRFNDASDFGRDASGYERDGLAVGFKVISDAVRGNVAQFNGGALLTTVPLERDFSVAFWVSTKQRGPDTRNWTDGPRLVDADISGPKHIDFGVGIWVDQLAFGIGDPVDNDKDATSMHSVTPVVDGQFHHIAVTRDGLTGVCQIFIDGQLDISETRAPGVLDLPPTINLGDLGNTKPVAPPLQAKMGDVRFYDIALSADAVARLASQ